jgi:hypothetical protein
VEQVVYVCLCGKSDWRQASPEHEPNEYKWRNFTEWHSQSELRPIQWYWCGSVCEDRGPVPRQVVDQTNRNANQGMEAQLCRNHSSNVVISMSGFIMLR